MPARSPLPRLLARAAFSLVELLAVIAIIAIMAGLIVPGLSSVLRSYNLNGTARALIGQLNLARQSAMARDQPVEVRFYQLPDDTNPSTRVIRCVQALQMSIVSTSTNTVYTPVTKPFVFPAGIVISSNTTASTLFNTSTFGTGSFTDPTQPAPYDTSSYYYFRFRGTGQTDMTLSTSSSPLLTLYPEGAKVVSVAYNLPADYITIEIDVINGSVRYYRP